MSGHSEKAAVQHFAAGRAGSTTHRHKAVAMAREARYFHVQASQAALQRTVTDVECATHSV